MTLRDHLGPRTPENAALHDELDRLLAARAVALEEAATLSDLAHAWWARSKGRDPVDYTSEHSRRAAAIRSLATTDSTEALDRVIRAHVEKALEMAKRSIVPDMTYKVEWQSSRGELVLNVEQILTEPVVARARLIWETSKEEAFAASGDTVEEAISRCIAWAAENAYEVPEAAPQPVTADDVLREMGGRGNG